MFLLVPAYPGCPGSKAVKRSLLLLLCCCGYVYKSVSLIIISLENKFISAANLHFIALSCGLFDDEACDYCVVGGG